MLDLAKNIHSLTDFKRRTPAFLREMKKSRQPVVLTVNGKAQVVVQDAASYQRMLEQAERMETLAAIKRGLRSMKKGKGKPADQVFIDIEKKRRYFGR